MVSSTHSSSVHFSYHFFKKMISLPALFRYNWHVTLCTTWWFDSCIHREMITTVSWAHISFCIITFFWWCRLSMLTYIVLSPRNTLYCLLLANPNSPIPQGSGQVPGPGQDLCLLWTPTLTTGITQRSIWLQKARSRSLNASLCDSLVHPSNFLFFPKVEKKTSISPSLLIYMYPTQIRPFFFFSRSGHFVFKFIAITTVFLWVLYGRIFTFSVNTWETATLPS